MVLHFAGTVGEIHSFTVKTTADDIVEATESFTAYLAVMFEANVSSGVTIDRTSDTAVITITDKDVSEVKVDWGWSNTWTVYEGDGVQDPVVEIPIELSHKVDVSVLVDFTIAGLGGWNVAATIPATNASGFVTPVRGTDDVSGLPNAQWNNTLGTWSVTIPADTLTHKIQVKLLSDDTWEAVEDFEITITNIREAPPAAGRAGRLTVSATKDTAEVDIWNDDY
jgi:hypothetical protein